MATYTELSTITSDAGWGAFYEKLRVAVVVKATDLLDGATPTALEVAWALAALESPSAAANGIQWYVVAVNKSVTVTQITGASDSAVQSNVDAAVNKIVSV